MNRALRLTVGMPPLLLFYLTAAIGERLEAYAGRAFWRLRDWMDCSR